MNEYEITRRVEVIREVSANIVTDLENYIAEKKIENSKDIAVIMLAQVEEIHQNIFSKRFRSIEVLEEIKAQLKFINGILVKLNI